MPQPRQLFRSVTGSRVRASLDQLLGSRFGRLLDRIGRGPRPADSESLLDHVSALLSLRGRASGPALASAFFDRYEASDLSERQAFLEQLHAHTPRDGAAVDRAIARWNEKRDDAAAAALHNATESPCAKLIRVLNLAPEGTRRLVAMRNDLLAIASPSAELRLLDREFEDAFTAWFNAGFLELRRIDWNSPAAVLERIIRYEAVHSIAGWDDLRRRVEPLDRRCYGFFHPQMADDPLIFVEVALTNNLPSAIAQIIATDRNTIDPREAGCAIFYSISNCQNGLRGIPFGNFLIKQVVGLLKGELPQLKQFATLSPVPGFAKWLSGELGEASVPGGDELRGQCARYITSARDKRGQVLDSVARFHLGNGARLEAVHTRADLSDKGQRQSHGVMVNYLYDLNTIEANHLRLFEGGEVAVSQPVESLLKAHGG
ncbi:MAG: malonyl-CoA decarboxylase family protein [Sphingomonadales bacterium]|nr:malonyl-CoA decarboxylase family protein [Sphingomonadales bacterium]